MTDDEFLKAFEASIIGPHDFPHRAHLRMAWLYLRRDGWRRGLHHIRRGIQHLAAAHGATRKYHETITVFWARIVWHAMLHHGVENDFEAIVRDHPYLLDARSVSRHYSDALLFSEAARSGWVEPDLLPLA